MILSIVPIRVTVLSNSEGPEGPSHSENPIHAYIIILLFCPESVILRIVGMRKYSILFNEE